MSREVILYTRQLCGLCDETAAELRQLSAVMHFTLSEFDIDDDDALRAEYNDIVPVVAAGGAVIAHAPIAPGELRDALAAALR